MKLRTRTTAGLFTVTLFLLAFILLSCNSYDEAGEQFRCVVIDPAVLACPICNHTKRNVELISTGDSWQCNPDGAFGSVTVYNASSEPGKDYISVNYKREKRAIRRFRTVRLAGNVHVPVDTDGFLWEWKRSKFIPCLGLRIVRSEEDSRRILDLKSVEKLAALRDAATSTKSTFIMFSGTLLGWYRECSMIPHTNDHDFVILAEEHSPGFLQYFEMVSKFKVYAVFGEPRECFQFKGRMTGAYMDISYLYPSENESFYCASVVDHRIKYRHPPMTIEDICVGDLLGKLMFIPCNPREHLQMAYGPGWKQDRPSRDFTWDRSLSNMIKRENNTGNSWTYRTDD